VAKRYILPKIEIDPETRWERYYIHSFGLYIRPGQVWEVTSSMGGGWYLNSRNIPATFTLEVGDKILVQKIYHRGSGPVRIQVCHFGHSDDSWDPHCLASLCTLADES
jgi:hypothetical protein